MQNGFQLVIASPVKIHLLCIKMKAIANVQIIVYLSLTILYSCIFWLVFAQLSLWKHFNSVFNSYKSDLLFM